MTGDAPPKLLRSLEELPREVTPERDLWPGIQSRLTPRRRSWSLPASWRMPSALAAGLLLAGVGVLIGLQVQNTRSPVVQQDTSAFVRAALLPDKAYETRRRELIDALPRKIESLSPESRTRVLDSLKAVQTAMQNLEAELGRDGSNALLQELFIGACQEEMRVLTAVDALGIGAPEI